MMKKKRGENRRKKRGTNPKLYPGGFSCSPPLLPGSGYRTPMSTLHPYILLKTIAAAKTMVKMAPKAIVWGVTSSQEENWTKMYKIPSQFCLQITSMYMYFPQKT